MRALRGAMCAVSIAAACSAAQIAPVLAAPVLAAPHGERIAESPAKKTVVNYAVRRGENLYTLARHYLMRPSDYRTVQLLNKIADPRRIPVGTWLRIPFALLKTEPLTARLVAVRGSVRLRRGAQDIVPQVGAPVEQGSVLETGADGFVAITLPNGSRTSLPTRTSLRIDHLRRVLLTNSIDYDFTVAGGKAEIKAAPLGENANNRFRIRTPRAIAAVRGTQFRVGFTDEISLAEVLEGTVAASADENAAPTDLSQGFGAVITSAGTITPEALLPAPDLLSPGKVQVDPLVRLAAAPLAGARGYHLQIAQDSSFAAVLAEASNDTGQFAFADIPNGGLFVRISAAASSGLEGMAQTFAMRRVLAGLAASASMDADTLRFAWGGQGEGSRIYHFQLGPNAPDGPLMIDEAGLTDESLALRHLPPGVYRWRVGLRQTTGEGTIENWLPFEKLTVAPQER